MKDKVDETDAPGSETATDARESVSDLPSEGVSEPRSEPISGPASEPVSEPASEPVADELHVVETPRTEESTVVPGIAALGLVRRYGTKVAVDGVSFEVRPGEVFGLLGPNGAGKTTLLRMLSGILEPDEGRAELLGHDVRKHPALIKRRLGYLSGDTALYRRLTGREILEYFGRLHRMPSDFMEQRIRAVSDELDLDDFIDQRCESLSSGQTQRVNLARAFLADPPVLILDEPTVGLDVISGRFVIEAIERARAANKAILFSTHIMSEVDALCDRVGLLLRGNLRAVGTRQEVLGAHGASNLGDVLLALDADSGDA